MAASDARRLLGPEAIVGVSVRSPAEIAQAERDGASYLAANGVWATATKTDFGEPLGLPGLRELASAAALPLVAIGGIDAGNAGAIAAAGCAGIAVVSAVMKAADPGEACRALRRAFEAGLRGSR
jgi:thiamine-phosphate diphosphorylase